MINKHLKNLIERNTIAVACIKVIDSKTMVITDNFMNKTKKNLLKNKKVALALWGKEEGYQLKGIAKYMTKGKWLNFVKNMKENRGLPTKGAVLIKVNEIYKL